jgi:hypothetical protein
MRCRRALLLALACGLPATAASGQVEGFHFTREVMVPSPGWVQVPLDLAALQHMAPGAADLHVLSPAGEELPLRVEPAATRHERRPVAVPKPARAEDGIWELVLDMGVDPVPHERLFLAAGRPPLSPPEVIEGSPDGSAWRPLAAGEPVRSDRGEDSGWLVLSYPATEDRYLRLLWPRGAAPDVEEIEVEAVTGPSLSVVTRNAGCETDRPGAYHCTLVLPATGQVVRRLMLEVTGEGRIGYRLDVPREGQWLLQTEGVWQRSGERTRHLLAGGPEPLADSLLRLELYGSPEAPPRLASWGAELAVQTVLFHAAEAGRYTLAYGGAPRREPSARPPAGAEGAWIEPAAEVEHAPPPLPAAATAPGVRLGSRRLAAAWRVIAPTVRPGWLVRLELPDVVYDAARADLGNLRLTAGERQIPYFLWSPAAPVLAIRKTELRPTPSDRRSRESELEIRLPGPGLPLTEIDLATPALLLRRAIGVRYREPDRPRRQNGWRKARNADAVVRETWECRPQPPLPCRQQVPLPGRAPQVLSVRFHDGDNPPLTGLEATVWRRRDVLLFVWPQTEEPVRLLAGRETLQRPSYDLAALGGTLLSHPWQPAELDLEGEAAVTEPRWTRWVMPLTLGIAGVCLILLLRRILAAA